MACSGCCCTSRTTLPGYVQALAALWLVGFAEDVTETSVALWAGIMLALALLFSTFTALIVGAAVGLLFAWRLTQQGRWRGAVQCAILGAVPTAVGVALTNALGYTDRRYGFLLEIGPESGRRRTPRPRARS